MDARVSTTVKHRVELASVAGPPRLGSRKTAFTLDVGEVLIPVGCVELLRQSPAGSLTSRVLMRTGYGDLVACLTGTNRIAH